MIITSDYCLCICSIYCETVYIYPMRGLGGVVVIDATIGAHGKSRPRFKPGTLRTSPLQRPWTSR